ncbi:hypothetical protein C5167_035196, partial [Papaver somniferum]
MGVQPRSREGGSKIEGYCGEDAKEVHLGPKIHEFMLEQASRKNCSKKIDGKDYGVDKYDIRNSFGHFGIAVENLTLTKEALRFTEVMGKAGPVKGGSTRGTYIRAPMPSNASLVQHFGGGMVYNLSHGRLKGLHYKQLLSYQHANLLMKSNSLPLAKAQMSEAFTCVHKAQGIRLSSFHSMSTRYIIHFVTQVHGLIALSLNFSLAVLGVPGMEELKLIGTE